MRVSEDACLDWRTHIVGPNNRINPATALAEFDAGRDELSEFEGGFDDRGLGIGPDNTAGADRGPNSNLDGGVINNALYAYANPSPGSGSANSVATSSRNSTFGGPPDLPNPSMEEAIYDPTGQSVRWAAPESDDPVSRALGVSQYQRWAGDRFQSEKFGNTGLAGRNGHVSAFDTSEHYLKPGNGDAYRWEYGDPYSDYEKSLNRVLPEIQRVIPDVSRASSYTQSAAPRPNDRWYPRDGEVKHDDLWRALEEILAPIDFGRPGE